MGKKLGANSGSSEPKGLFETKLTNLERRVLEAIKENKDKLDRRKLKLQFWDEIKAGFDLDAMDQRLFRGERLSLCARWLLDPKDSKISDVDLVIRAITKALRDEKNSPATFTDLTAEVVAQWAGIPKESVFEAFERMREFGDFSNGSRRVREGFGWDAISLSDYGDHLNAYINYEGVDACLEDAWRRHAPYIGPGRGSADLLQFAQTDWNVLMGTQAQTPQPGPKELVYLSRRSTLQTVAGDASTSFNKGILKDLFEQFVLNGTLGEDRIREVLLWNKSKSDSAGKVVKDLNRKLREDKLDLKIGSVGGQHSLSQRVRILN